MTPIYATLTHAGTISINGSEAIGVFLSMEADELRNAPRLPFYRRVAVVEVPDGQDTIEGLILHVQDKVGLCVSAAEHVYIVAQRDARIAELESRISSIKKELSGAVAQ
jgi:hypothetical protein